MIIKNSLVNATYRFDKREMNLRYMIHDKLTSSFFEDNIVTLDKCYLEPHFKSKKDLTEAADRLIEKSIKLEDGRVLKMIDSYKTEYDIFGIILKINAEYIKEADPLQ